jgi:hypothetical protein
VPAVAGGNQHGIHIGPLGQELAQVGIRSTIFRAVLTVHRVLGGLSLAFYDITDGDPLHIGLVQHRAQIIGTAAAEADAAHHDPFAGRNGSVTPQRGGRDIPRQRHRTCGHCSACQEPAPCEWSFIGIAHRQSHGYH